jgi:hypothetical protein
VYQHHSPYKNLPVVSSQKHQNLTKLLSINDSGAHFSVSNTEFEGGGDGHGHDEGTFGVK